MNLYPLKFTPIFKEKIWGGNKLGSLLNKDCNKNIKTGESWEISAIEDEVSVVSNGFLKDNSLEELIEIYMGDLVGDKVYDEFGIEFPLLIKYIDAKEDLSIQVHPDNALAKQRHKAYGKTEMWYVIQADLKSQVSIGFNKEVEKLEYLQHVEGGKIEDLLSKENIQEGECYIIPAGKVHTIGKGSLVAEIQQTSDITYRIFDYNRKDNEGNTRELHTQLATEAIDYSYEKKHRIDYTIEANKSNDLLKTEYFTSKILEFDKQIDLEYYHLDSFKIFMSIEGEYDIIYDEQKMHVTKGETILIPASMTNFSISPKGEAKILEIYI